MNIKDALWSKSLVNQKNIQRFIDFYAKTDNWHNIDRKTANLGYGWIHYALIRMLQPKRILCIGSKFGFIPGVCALACKDNTKGIVDFVDAGYDQADHRHNINLGAKKSTHWGGVGFWKITDITKHFNHFGLAPYILFFLTTSDLFAASHTSRRWQYIYLDGDHSYEGVQNDFNLFFPKLEKGGCFVFHDIYTTRLGGMPYGVNRFWKELKNKKRYNYFEFPGICGVGIVQT